MDLEAMSEFIREVEEGKERIIAKVASSIGFKDIEEHLQPNPPDFLGGRYYDFKRGDKVNFSICNGNYDISFCPDKLTLFGPGNRRLRVFEGEEVTEAYNNFVESVQRIRAYRAEPHCD